MNENDTLNLSGAVKSQSRFLERLVKIKVTNSIKNPHIWIILLMVFAFIFCTYVVFPNFYDVYVIFLFPPLIYTALAYRLRGAIIGSIIFVCILVPHSLPLSLDTYILVRSFVFIAFPFLVSGLVAIWLDYFERQLKAYNKILDLNNKLNSNIDQLEKTQKQLLQAEKLHALGQLSAAIAHEINNPIAGVIVYSQLLQKKIKSHSFNQEEALDILAKMESALTSSGHLVRSLLDFARQTTPTLKPVIITQVIDQVIALVGHQAKLGKVRILRQEENALPPVKGDFSQLQQVFINLVVNGIQSMTEGGTLTISSAQEGPDLVRISIRDTGCGMTQEVLDNLFTPFFSTKEAVKGVGLGLAVSYGIIERHGGRIEVQSEVNKGSVFSVFLPVFKEDTSGNTATQSDK